MMIGVYTGGTPNLAAIARALGVEEDLYILTHTVELVIGAVDSAVPDYRGQTSVRTVSETL